MDHTRKVIDLVVESFFCLTCGRHKTEKRIEDSESWYEEHAENCTINHEGSSGKMEVNSIWEMFMRWEELHDVQYTSYIGDGVTKIY